MDYQRRDQRIKDLRRKDPKTWTLARLGREHGITAERIRQICEERSKSDSRRIEEKIRFDYFEYLKKLSNIQLENEIKRLALQNRKKRAVIQRRVLVIFLKDVRGFSFLKIAKLLKRDHTSIINLYRTHQ